MVDFKKEIVDHVTGEIDSSILDESADNEVAVPSVHFVESPARHDVRLLQIKKTWPFDRADVDLSQLLNHDG